MLKALGYVPRKTQVHTPMLKTKEQKYTPKEHLNFFYYPNSKTTGQAQRRVELSVMATVKKKLETHL